MVWFPAAVGHILFPWQLSATRRAMMAVLPKPMLPTITTPRLLEGSPLRRWASTSWKSHSLPLNSQSDESPGISKCRGFRLREGVKETVGDRGLLLCLFYLFICFFFFKYVFTSVFLLTTTPRILSGHSEGCSRWDMPLLLIQVS